MTHPDNLTGADVFDVPDESLSPTEPAELVPWLRALPDGWQPLTDSIWKRPGVEEYAGGRALAWFDDEFGPADFEWAAKRTLNGAPTLPVQIDPARGIGQQDVDQVAEWVASIREPEAIP